MLFVTNFDRLQLLVLNALTELIPLYPSLHRALQQQISALTLKCLNGSTPRPTSSDLLEAASSLYSVLHLTGGKVGGTSYWRKSLEDTLAFAWDAFHRLRSTFSESQSGPSNEDPLIYVPLNMDRMRVAVHVLCDLLR